ncbi:MAG: FKBP-type peptidyl-prolyl cis-trans isomerase, partial [Planctomycetota bacterium]
MRSATRLVAMLTLLGGGVVLCACDPPAVTIASQRDRSVRYKDIRDGKGREALEGTQIACHYRGYLPDGEKFMDTRKLGRGKAHVWNVGDGTVIAGIDIAVRGMKPGG